MPDWSGGGFESTIIADHHVVVVQNTRTCSRMDVCGTGRLTCDLIKVNQPVVSMSDRLVMRVAGCSFQFNPKGAFPFPRHDTCIAAPRYRVTL